MPKPKRSSDDYIQLKKKIVEKDLRNIVLTTARDQLKTPQEVCYDWIRERGLEEIKKRKQS